MALSLQEDLAETLRARGDIALTEMPLYDEKGTYFGEGARVDVWHLVVKWRYRVFIERDFERFALLIDPDPFRSEEDCDSDEES